MKSSHSSQNSCCWWCVFPILLILLASLVCMPTTALCRPPDRTSGVETPGDPTTGERSFERVPSGSGHDYDLINFEQPEIIGPSKGPTTHIVSLYVINLFLLVDQDHFDVTWMNFKSAFGKMILAVSETGL